MGIFLPSGVFFFVFFLLPLLDSSRPSTVESSSRSLSLFFVSDIGAKESVRTTANYGQLHCCAVCVLENLHWSTREGDGKCGGKGKGRGAPGGSLSCRHFSTPLPATLRQKRDPDTESIIRQR